MSGTVIAGGILGGLIALALGMALPNLPTGRRYVLLFALLGIYWAGLYIAVDKIAKGSLE